MDRYEVNRKMLKAVRSGDLDTTAKLLRQYGLFYCRNWSTGYNLLREATGGNHTEVAKFLLETTAKVNSTNDHTSTPLHNAVLYTNVELVKILLEKNASVRKIDDCGNTPLRLAVKPVRKKSELQNNIEIIDLLLKHGSDLHATVSSDLKTPLFDAIERRGLETVKTLISHCKAINFANAEGDCCKQEGSCHYESCKLKGYTALHFAVSHGKTMVVDLLMDNGADVNIGAKEGKTALHLAAEYGYVDIAEKLMDRGASVNAVYTSGKLEGCTPLHSAVWGEKFRSSSSSTTETPGNTKLIEMLLNKGANANAPSENYGTPLHTAAELNCEKLIELFLKNGANPNALTKDGKTVLHVAVEKGHFKIVEDLCKICPDLKNERNSDIVRVAVLIEDSLGRVLHALLRYGFSVGGVGQDLYYDEMFYAFIMKGYSKVVEEFLKLGFDVNKSYRLTDEKSFFPLHIAVQKRRVFVVDLLIKHGADVNAQDDAGKTPISYITYEVTYHRFGREEVSESLTMVELLLKNGANGADNPELLLSAVKNSNISFIELLLNYKADVNWGDSEGLTALHYAVCISYLYADDSKLDVVKLLVRRKANVVAKTKTGISVLHLAALFNSERLEVLETLLEFDADVNVSCDGVTPLHLSVFMGNDIFCKVLLSKGANVDAKLKGGETALHVAVSPSLRSTAFKIFSEFSGYPRLLWSTLSSAFRENSCQIYRKQEEIIQVLVKFGADVKSQNDDGKTALHFASEDDFFAATKLVPVLIKYGVEVTITDRFLRIPLHYAASTSAIENLVYSGSDVNCRDIDGCSPLHMHVKEVRCGDLVTESLKLGADINALNNANLTPHEEALNVEKQLLKWTSALSRFRSNVISPLKAHIVMLKAANLYVNPKNLAAYGMSWDNDFYDECKREVDLMKTEKVRNSNFSYYDILTCGRNQLVRLSKNKAFAQEFIKEKFNHKFPIYNDMFKLIELYVKQAPRRARLLELSMASFQACIFDLPDVCLDLVLDHLSDGDLTSLSRVYYTQDVIPKPVDFSCDDNDGFVLEDKENSKGEESDGSPDFLSSHSDEEDSMAEYIRVNEAGIPDYVSNSDDDYYEDSDVGGIDEDEDDV